MSDQIRYHGSTAQCRERKEKGLRTAERSSEEVKLNAKKRLQEKRGRKGEWHKIVADNGSAATTIPFMIGDIVRVKISYSSTI
jgi:hypothetical protein